MNANERAAAEREYYHQNLESRAAFQEEIFDRVGPDFRALLAYMWPDEERDYNEQDEEGQADHIFNSMRRLAAWLDELEKECS